MGLWRGGSPHHTPWQPPRCVWGYGATEGARVRACFPAARRRWGRRLAQALRSRASLPPRSHAVRSSDRAALCAGCGARSPTATTCWRWTSSGTCAASSAAVQAQPGVGAHLLLKMEASTARKTTTGSPQLRTHLPGSQDPWSQIQSCPKGGSYVVLPLLKPVQIRLTSFLSNKSEENSWKDL